MDEPRARAHRLVDLDLVLATLRRQESSSLLTPRSPAEWLGLLYARDPSALIGLQQSAPAPTSVERRLASAAARALERLEVADDDAGGAVAEARAILQEVVHLDGTPKTSPAPGSGPDQLGVCPACGREDTVVNPESDLFVCGRPGEHGCGATWRGARLGVPE